MAQLTRSEVADLAESVRSSDTSVEWTSPIQSPYEVITDWIGNRFSQFDTVLTVG